MQSLLCNKSSRMPAFLPCSLILHIHILKSTYLFCIPIKTWWNDATYLKSVVLSIRYDLTNSKLLWRIESITEVKNNGYYYILFLSGVHFSQLLRLQPFVPNRAPLGVVKDGLDKEMRFHFCDRKATSNILYIYSVDYWSGPLKGCDL